MLRFVFRHFDSAVAWQWHNYLQFYCCLQDSVKAVTKLEDFSYLHRKNAHKLCAVADGGVAILINILLTFTKKERSTSILKTIT